MRNECNCNFLPCFLFPVSWVSVEEREEEERREQKESRNKYACNAYVTAVTLYALFFFFGGKQGQGCEYGGCSFSIWQPGGVRRGPPLSRSVLLRPASSAKTRSVALAIIGVVEKFV